MCGTTASCPWVALGRYLADHIEGAEFVALPGGSLSIPLLLRRSHRGNHRAPHRGAPRLRDPAGPHNDALHRHRRIDPTGRLAGRPPLAVPARRPRPNRARPTPSASAGERSTRPGTVFVISFDGPARTIRCAEAIVKATATLGIELRTGLHTGECEVRGDNLGGLAVHIVARVGALAAPGEVLVSGTVKDLVVGSGVELTNRGEHELKGVPGTWNLFSVKD